MTRPAGSIANLHGRHGGPKWSAEEDETLRRIWAGKGTPVHAELPGRSNDALYRRARIIGLCAKSRPWTQREDDCLTMIWGLDSIEVVARKPKRSQAAVYHRAYSIGLSRDEDEGLETLRQAAKRTGYAAHTLKTILKAAGLTKYHKRAAIHPSARKIQRVLEKANVDAAVALWLTFENVGSAARVRGLVADTLASWLIAAGVKKATGSRKGWRVESDVIDRVIAERRVSEGLAAASRRVNVSQPTLRKWLIAEGFAPTGARAWVVPIAEVDRIVAARRGLARRMQPRESGKFATRHETKAAA